jgi:hypothetical protein
MSAIMGDAEPTELRLEDVAASLRAMTIKAREQEATMARKPRMAMRAIAQCGNGGLMLVDWMLPTALLDGRAADNADAEDAAAIAVDDMDAMTESAYVVSVAQRVGKWEMAKKERALTDGAEGGLGYLRTVEGVVAPHDEPIIRIWYVDAIPVATLCPKPSVVYLRADDPCLICRVCLVRKREYLCEGVCTVEEDVDEVRLCQLWKLAVPCRRCE